MNVERLTVNTNFTLVCPSRKSKVQEDGVLLCICGKYATMNKTTMCTYLADGSYVWISQGNFEDGQFDEGHA